MVESQGAIREDSVCWDYFLSYEMDVKKESDDLL